MATYLLTWNPNKWWWWDDDEGEEAAAASFMQVRDWSCVSKSVVAGDRVFLLRQGKEPRGIFAAGVATSSPYPAENWDGSGREKQFVGVRWDPAQRSSLDPILSRAALDTPALRDMHWGTQSSGIAIPDRVASALETAWTRASGSRRAPVPVSEAKAIEGAMKEALIFTRSRSRTLRDKALAAAAGVCAACGKNYGRLLGGKGKRVLQVHHTKQLALRDTPRVTTLADLAVVCANCHLLLHADPTRALPVKELRRLLNGS